MPCFKFFAYLLHGMDAGLIDERAKELALLFSDNLNDPFLLRWEKANIVWFGKDKTLTKEAHFVHQQLLKKKINHYNTLLQRLMQLIFKNKTF